MNSPALLYLDFAAPTRSLRGRGLVLCVSGLVAATAVGIAFNAALAERSHLDAALESVSQQHRTPATSPARSAAAAEAAKIAKALSLPWTAVLTELEDASHDMASEVSLLGVEPDPEKHVVRITAEVRALPDALAYLERLQQSKVLRFPMLESHERVKDSPEHPVRIKVVAEWRT